MRKLILIATLTLSTVAQADYCQEIEGLARTIMNNRQNDVPLVSMIKTLKDSELAKKMTLDAYEKPMFSGKAYKDKSINKFANTWYMACLKSNKTKGNH